MKRFLLVCLLAILLVAPKSVFANDESPWEKKLPFKSCTISYVISGMEEGQETLYIRDHGKQRATYHETVTKAMGMLMKNSTLELTTPDYIYSYDLQNREGTKTINPQKYMIEAYNELSVADKKKVLNNAEKTGMAYTEGMPGQLQYNAVKILGYSCDKVEIMGGPSVYLIHGTDIPLKTEMDMMGMKISMVAKSVNKGDVDEKFFEHPDGINAEVDEEADAMAGEMAKQVIAMLKDPENAPKIEGQPMGFPGEGVEMSEEDKKMMEQAEKMMQGLKRGLGQ